MKYNILSFIIFSILISSCQNEDTLITDINEPASQLAEFREIDGIVQEEFSLMRHNLSRLPLSNVTIKLMHDGVMLDEVNTNESGFFEFSKQAVPQDEAYLIFEAPGFYKNVSRVLPAFKDSLIDVAHNDFVFNLVRKNFEGASGGAIDDVGPYIKLKIEPKSVSGPLFYITNSNNELIGARTNISPDYDFEITTFANEKLFFHYQTLCSTETVEMGPFSEDTNITDLVSDFAYELGNWETVRVAAYDCQDNAIALDQWEKMYTANGLTKWDANFTNISYFIGTDCLFELYPDMSVGVATSEPRMYGETSFTYSEGQNGILDITLCEEDDTYLNYSIGGGPEVIPDLFTYANILPNGHLLLKQKAPRGEIQIDISFLTTTSIEVGSAEADVIFTNSRSGSAEIFSTVGNNLIITITNNDGQFLEGTFDGQVYDGFESSLGNLTGAFRARIL